MPLHPNDGHPPPPASVTLALTPLHRAPGSPQGQEGWGDGGTGGEERGGVTQMREDIPGGGTAPRELEVMNILTERRGSNEFKLNYMCWAPREDERHNGNIFKGADIITPFRKFDKREISVRQSKMQKFAPRSSKSPVDLETEVLPMIEDLILPSPLRREIS